MARQDLAYAITVNDAELRLATQHVAAFNAEMELSTVTGRKLDETMRAVGRRTSQVGNFFIRNLTVPLGLVGFAAGKMAADFETSLAKIQGLTQTSTKDTQRLAQSALAIGGRIITKGPAELADAMFKLQSVGFKTNQTIAVMPSIAKAAAAGLGSVETVADAVASAFDAYGIKGLQATNASEAANKAIAVLIGTITAGKIAPEALAASIGRVIPVANAMGISFDQVGASIASMTRQGLNANLAVTGLRAFLSTLLRAQPSTQKALAAIGTTADAVRQSLADPHIGIFPTVIALREEFNKLGKRPINLSQKELTAAANGSADALSKVKAQVGDANEALSKAFPNIRALTAFLIITGPRRGQNANIFAQLKQDVLSSQAAIKKAYDAKASTPIGRFQLAVGQLKTELTQIGPTAILVGERLAHLAGSAINFFKSLGPFKGIAKDIGIGLLLFGPVVSIFGRLTQAASGGVLLFGRWQLAAQKAAFATRGINIEEDKLLIAQRNATVQFEQGMSTMTTSANRTAAAVAGIGTAARGIRGQLAGATGGNALFGRVSGGTSKNGPPVVSTPNVLAAQNLVAFQARRNTQLAALRAREALATERVQRAQQSLALNAGIGATSAVRATSAELQQAKAALEVVRAERLKAETLAQIVFQDERIVTLTRQLQVSTERQQTLAAQGATILAEREALVAASLEQQILLRQKLLARGITNPGGGFAAFDSRARAIQSRETQNLAAESVAAARILPTKWGVAVEGMKSTAKLGFDFIALAFATDVVAKMIFGGEQARHAVVHDFESIATSGTALIAVTGALGLGLATLGPRIRAAGGARAAFEGLSAVTLGWRAKIALAGAALVGLKATGVSTSTALNAGMAGLIARQVALRAGIFEVGSAFGPWGIAAATAATIILSQTGLVEKELNVIDSLLGKITTHIPGGNFIKGTLERTLFGGLDVKQIKGLFDFLSGKDKQNAQKKKPSVVGGITKQEFDLLTTDLPAATVKIANELRSAGHEYAAEQLLAKERTHQQFVEVKNAVALLRKEGHAGAAAILAGGIAKQIKAAKDQTKALFGQIDQSVSNAFEAHTQSLLDKFDRGSQTILDNFDVQSQKLEDNLRVKVKVKGETFTIKVNGKTPAERELAALDKVQQKRTFQRDIFDARQELATAFQVGDPNAIRDAQRKLQDGETEQKKFGLEKRATVERTAADAAEKKAKETFANSRKRLRQNLEDTRAEERRNLNATRTIQEQNLKNALSAEAALFNSGKIGLAKYKTDVLGIMRRFGVSLAQAGHDGGKAYADQMAAQFAKLTSLIGTQVDKLDKKIGKVTTKWQRAAQGLAASVADARIQAGMSKAGIAAAVKAASGSGLPTRPAILRALQRVPGGTNFLGVVPQRGQPSAQEYQRFLGKLTPGPRRQLRALLQSEGFFAAATGAVVPGSGTGDTVPAMLTPGEIVLNKPQQRRLGAMIGKPGASPDDLFAAVSKFAGGGVIRPQTGTPDPRFTVPGGALPPIQVDGLSDLTAELKKLVSVIAKNAKTQQDLPQDPRTSELILGGVLNKKGKLVLSSSARLSKLRQALDPVSAHSELSSVIPHFGSLPVGKKRDLEAAVARLQAHPVRSGLITPTPTGTVIGGDRRLAPSREISATAFAGGGGGGGHHTTIQNLTIKVEGAGDPDAVGQRVRREFERVATHVVPQRRG